MTLFYVFAGIAVTVCAGPRPRDPGGPAAPRPAVLPGRLPAAADDHADRRGLHVPDDDRHREGPARAALRGARPDALHVGDGPVGGPDRGRSSATRGSGRRSCSSCCWRRSRGSTSRSARRRSSTAPRSGRSFRHITWPAILPVSVDDRPHPPDRGLQDRRHAEHPDRRRAGHRDPVADARGVPRLADAEPRQLGGDRLHPVDPRHGHRLGVRRLVAAPGESRY